AQEARTLWRLPSQLGTHPLDLSVGEAAKAAILPCEPSTAGTVNPSIATLVERLDKTEARDLILCVLYILHNLPKKTLGAFWCAQEDFANNNIKGPSGVGSNGLLDFIGMLSMAADIFQFRGKAYYVKEQAKKMRMDAKLSVNFQRVNGPLESQHSSVSTFTDAGTLTLEDDTEGANASIGFLQEQNLIQEVGLIVLDVAQTLSNQIAGRGKQLYAESTDAAFDKLLKLELNLLGDNWPEAVRLHALASLAVFINLFESRFFQNGPLLHLSMLITSLLKQLSSRFVKVQNAAAALMQLVLRHGYDKVSPIPNRPAEGSNQSRPAAGSLSFASATERLGRPGTQTGVALANLLGTHDKNVSRFESVRFERGLNALEGMVSSYGHRRPSDFEEAVLELIKQLRGVMDATSALQEAERDPIRLADLHIQLANSYRGSAALRCAWFETLARKHRDERWFSEAAVCQAHQVAIIGKELLAKGELSKIDWEPLDVYINKSISIEENVHDDKMCSTQQGEFTPVTPFSLLCRDAAGLHEKSGSRAG
ncbi:Dedicator of cytokinesis family protein, partial [Aphelenchoides avenae]